MSDVDVQELFDLPAENFLYLFSSLPSFSFPSDSLLG